MPSDLNLPLQEATTVFAAAVAIASFVFRVHSCREFDGGVTGCFSQEVFVEELTFRFPWIGNDRER